MSRKKMSEVKEPKGGYLTLAGKFEMEIIEVVEGTAKSGNTTNKIKLECDEGILYDNVTMIEKSMGFVKRYLSAAGYDIDDLEYEVNKKGAVTALYLDDEKWSFEELLTDEPTVVLVTTGEGEKSYKDPVDGTTKIVEDPMAKIKSIEFIEED